VIMRAFVTLLSSENYLQGVVGLSRSLAAVNSAYPLYCAVSADMPAEIDDRLASYGISVIRLTEQMEAPDAAANREFPQWSRTFDKLLVWGLTQFEKIVFVDSDIIVVENIDDLFEYPDFSAVISGRDFPGNESWDFMNSGVVVLTPDVEILRRLKECAASLLAEHPSSAGDQDVLERFLPRWKDCEELHLGQGYNMTATYLDYYIRYQGYGYHGEPLIRTLHFTGALKPWQKMTFRQRLKQLELYLRQPHYRRAVRRCKPLWRI